MWAGAEPESATCLAFPCQRPIRRLNTRVPQPCTTSTRVARDRETRRVEGCLGGPMAPRVPDDTCFSHFLWAKSPSPGLNADSLQGMPSPRPGLEVRSLWEPGRAQLPSPPFPGCAPRRDLPPSSSPLRELYPGAHSGASSAIWSPYLA